MTLFLRCWTAAADVYGSWAVFVFLDSVAFLDQRWWPWFQDLHMIIFAMVILALYQQKIGCLGH